MTGVTLSSSKCILVPGLAKSPSGFFLLPKEDEGSGTILDPRAPLFQLKLAQNVSERSHFPGPSTV